MLGGYSAPKEATSEVQAVVDKLKSQVEGQTNKTYSTFKLEKFSTQVVNGLNYKLKIQVGDGDYIHVTAHRPPIADAEPTLKEVQEGKSASDSF